MYCKSCGTALPEGARFCSACGAPVTALPELVSEPEVPRAAELPELVPEAAPASAAELPELVPDPEPPKPAPLMEVPEPTAPMYTPVEPEPVYAEPAYAQPVYAEPAQMIPQSEVDAVYHWGIAGLVCAFLITILGIVFSAIAMSKAKRMLRTYGFLPQQARTGRGLGIAGLVISIVITALGLLFFIAIIAAIAYGVSSGSFYYY